MKIALIGYGKMGKMIEQLAKQRGHEIVSIIDIDNRDEIDSDKFASADVAIEFSTPQAAFRNCTDAMQRGVKVVSGTTGWLDSHKEEVKQLCATGNTLFWSSNFSVGVAVFSAVNRYLAELMNSFPQYEVRMSETHHVHKLDHPSGTAISLATDIVNRLDRKSAWQRGTLTQPDGVMIAENKSHPDYLSIDSVRQGEVPGVHSVTYESEADRITITHEAHSRLGFALGAVLAAEFTHTHTGFLSINDMFKF